MRALGRLGQAPQARRRRSTRLAVRRAGTATIATRRPAIPRPVLLALLTVVAALVYLGAIAANQTGEPLASGPGAVAASGRVAVAPPAVPPRNAVTAADRSRREDRRVFGAVDGLELVLPHAEPLAIAFHEATRPEGLPLDPFGVLEANDNASRYVAPADADGPPYRVLSSRGRGRPATSAVDIVLPDGAMALAPVTGTVVDVRRYTLSGTLDDWRVVIEPAARPDLHLVMIHLHEPQVAVGDSVTAGTTPLAVARLLPFASHVDYTMGERHPHVHVEVKPATPPVPLDPNAPAVDPAAALGELARG
jgi:hypothetical protein